MAMVLSTLLFSCVLLTGPEGGGEHPEAATPLASAQEEEQESIHALLGSDAWPRRAIAVLRLQRFDCPESANLLEMALADPAPQVRSFAITTLAHRNHPQGIRWLKEENDPKVIRSMLRCGYQLETERLRRGVSALARSSKLQDKLTAAELGLASGEEDLAELAEELLRTVILRMNDAEAGSFSPRLARITSGPDIRRDYKWRMWYQKHRNNMGIDDAIYLSPRPQFDPDAAVAATPSHPGDLSEIARIPFEKFTQLASHLEKLAEKPLDLAIVIDCTASMSGEIADAQGGLDDLMVFTGDVCKGVRVGVAGYRDRRAKDFEQIGWDFSSSITVAREHLWKLSALGGGDRPELVDKGLQIAYRNMTWNPIHRGIVVLVGDAPPHPGRGTYCVNMARAARGRGVTTHVIGCDPSIQDSEPAEETDPTEEFEEAHPYDTEKGVPARSKPAKRTRRPGREKIEFFQEIAAAGGGRVVNLDRDERLVPEIAGLIVGKEFEEPLVQFFTIYMQLCR